MKTQPQLILRQSFWDGLDAAMRAPAAVIGPGETRCIAIQLDTTVVSTLFAVAATEGCFHACEPPVPRPRFRDAKCVVHALGPLEWMEWLT